MIYKIALYGRLRQAGNVIVLEAPENITAQGLLKALADKLGPKATLLHGCVLATDFDILPGNARAPDRLSALPPVCGG